ncbi:MAG: Oxygen-independent coproporphyrinogen-III oxidase-like protein YqeR [Chlamydiae bacterium]|nr:Oxygen-independent coproporphyrinogen-III oxidase-like protein YqeR [Chlamydiota bacterium]
MEGEEYSLYVHVPFCTRKCDYCHFYVVPDKESFHALYLESLKREWELRAPLLHGKKLVSLYFGGGTPSLLSPEELGTILSWIDPPSKTEITLEANPENLTREKLKAFRNLSCNRLSIGVQSFVPSSLQVLSRTHSASRAKQAIYDAAEPGFDNISIDLMYDLPGQSLANWKESLEIAATLPITHLSLYNLTFEPHTLFYKKRTALQKTLPSEESSLEMLELAVEAFSKPPWNRYEISAFAKGGMISNHNIGYWTGRPFLGLGPSAFSYWEGRRFRNTPNLNRYAKALREGEDPTDFTETLPPVEQAKELLAVGLRLLNGVQKHTLSTDLNEILSLLVGEEWVESTDDTYRLTPQGLLFHDTVAELIFRQ